MGNLLAYSGIVTKVRAMQAKLLTDEDFQNIAAFHTVTEVAAYLKEHPGYRNVLADMDENRLHRGEIEKLLVQSLYSDYTRLYRFSGMDQKKFLELYLKRYEMNLINYCLRIVFNHYEKPFDLDHKKIFFDKYSDLSIDKLDCQHFFRQIFLGYFSDIVQAFDTLRKNVCGDDYTSLHNPIVLSSVLPAYGMFHSIQILFL